MQAKAPQAKTELVASTTGIVPGKKFSVALHMTMDPGWHSYYINPGESGAPPTIKWHLPAGFKAGPILWPVPTRIVVGGVAGYVYQSEAWFVTDITAASGLTTGESVHIGADVSWLLCEKVCVPEKSSLALDLKVVDNADENPTFLLAAAGLPKSSPATHISATANKKQAVLTVKGFGSPEPRNVQFYPADPTYFGADPAVVKSTPAGINLTLPLSRYAPGAPKRVTGILVVDIPGAQDAHWVDVKVTER